MLLLSNFQPGTTPLREDARISEKQKEKHKSSINKQEKMKLIRFFGCSRAKGNCRSWDNRLKVVKEKEILR